MNMENENIVIIIVVKKEDNISELTEYVYTLHAACFYGNLPPTAKRETLKISIINSLAIPC